MALQMVTKHIKDWKLDELDNLLDSIEDDIAGAIQNCGIKTGEDYTNLVLRMAGRAIVSMREIIRLCAQGFPDGALAIARNIYESLIVMAFLEGHKNDSEFKNYVEDYFEDYSIQRNKALRYESKNCTHDLQELASLEQEYEQAKSRAHHKVSGDYWWSGYPSFNKLVEATIETVSDNSGKRFLYGLHFAYKRACVSIHSSCMGNTLRLGTDSEFAGIDTAQTLKGHSLPLWFSTVSLIYILGVVYDKLGIDYEACDNTLNELALFYHQREVKKRETSRE